MKDAKHTPGPWSQDRKLRVGPRSNRDDQSYGMIEPLADVYGENSEADARLITAAPELLEACLRLVGSLGVMIGDLDNCGDIVYARAAITKATGRADSADGAQKGTP